MVNKISRLCFLLIIAASAVLAQDKRGIFVGDSLKTKKNILRTKTALDTASVVDSSKIAAEYDTLVIINYTTFSALDSYPTRSQKKTINSLDYRYTGDVFTYLPFGYLNNHGSLGQPHEVSIYGLGFNSISYNQDGMPVNNRISNSYDLTSTPTEYIDSLEVLPLASGFLYGAYNNPVTVNFNTRDSLSKIPYSKLRFYQGPEEEAFVDVIFNAQVTRRINFSFEVTNQKVASRYINSEFAMWGANSKIRYLFSNKLNTVLSYSYSRAEMGLNGGVDYEKLINESLPGELEENLYSPSVAPVHYGLDGTRSIRYQKNFTHNFGLKLLGNFVKDSPTDLSIYYQFHESKFRSNEFGYEETMPQIKNDNKATSIGATFRQLFSINNIGFETIANIENVYYNADILDKKKSQTVFSIGGRANFGTVTSQVSTSLFAKYLNLSNNSFMGVGGTITYKLDNHLKVFAGVSAFQKPYNIVEEQFITADIVKTDQKIQTLEAGLSYSSNLVKVRASYFTYKNSNAAYPIIDEYTDSIKIAEIGFYQISELKNFGVNLNTDVYWKNILLSGNLSYIVSEDETKNQLMPDLTFTGGLYYVDTLFNDNLKLKTGITTKYYGGQSHLVYDYQFNSAIRHIQKFNSNSVSPLNNSITDPGYQIDLFLAGTIQNSAIVYFVYENILGKDYYIIPYYPLQSRGIRFGLSWEFLD